MDRHVIEQTVVGGLILLVLIVVFITDLLHLKENEVILKSEVVLKESEEELTEVINENQELSAHELNDRLNSITAKLQLSKSIYNDRNPNKHMDYLRSLKDDGSGTIVPTELAMATTELVLQCLANHSLEVERLVTSCTNGVLLLIKTQYPYAHAEIYFDGDVVYVVTKEDKTRIIKHSLAFDPLKDFGILL